MTDRELLELAAKASGRTITAWNTRYGVDVAVLDDGSYWQPLLDNPITDADGDALRLAVRIGLILDCLNAKSISAERKSQGHNDWVYGDEESEPDDDSAIRRAAVLAAAEIGKSMP